METVVYLILAVLVMAILLYFLTSQTRPVEDITRWEREAAQYCTSYVIKDPECTRTSVVGATKDGAAVVKSIVETCTKLKRLGCILGGNPQTCIQSCCLGCRTRPA